MPPLLHVGIDTAMKIGLHTTDIVFQRMPPTLQAQTARLVTLSGCRCLEMVYLCPEDSETLSSKTFPVPRQR